MQYHEQQGQQSVVAYASRALKPSELNYPAFHNAFDKVPHQRLLLKLKAHGIGNDVINWIEKWLTHRKQRVIVDGEISNCKSVLSGVPQGSVLGPILFINDI